MFGNTYSVKSPQELYESTQQAITYLTLNGTPVLPGGSWKLTNQSSSESSFGALFYQFSGLYDYVGCVNGTTSGRTACAPFFPNTSSAIYNGVQFSAYNVGLSYSNDHQFAPTNGVLLSTPNNILSCASPSTETFSMWLDPYYAYAFLSCDDQLYNNPLNSNNDGQDITGANVNVNLIFYPSINVYAAAFNDATYNPTYNYSIQFGNVYDNVFHGGNTGVYANNILAFLPVTNPPPDSSTATVYLNVVLNMLGDNRTQDYHTNLIISLQSAASNGLFCYQVNPAGTTTSNLFAVCTSAYTGNSYSLGVTYSDAGNSTWLAEWGQYPPVM